ncbi:hypothetical protein ElyMa_004298800 [Elysia marginata]|uniref:Uncharacterized protein n=1 Tax=Elysia marginata TaxID=1093978 RepID=A0AAV4GWB6_9GAST|nr:hypothetical protein ElyMa_004298800 [Elysia marginata]
MKEIDDNVVLYRDDGLAPGRLTPRQTLTPSLTQSLDLWVRRGDLRAQESAFCRHASLSEADLTSSYNAIPVHSLMLSHQAFFCRPRLRLPSTRDCALENCLGKAVVSGDMSKPSQFPPFHCRQ